MLYFCNVGMLFHFVDEMYISEASLLHEKWVALSIDVIDQALGFQKWAAVNLIIISAATNAVRFSFLYLFEN